MTSLDNLDLFTPIVTKAAQHPNFRAISEVANIFNFDVLNQWACDFRDRDGKFVKEFQTTFNSSFWELYLFAVLKHFDLHVDWSFSSPDFCVMSKSGMNIEAAIASHADGSTPEFDRDGAKIPIDLNEFNRQAIVRVRNSLEGKKKKYFRHYSSLDHVQNKPFILALTAFDHPYAPLACQRAIEAALLGYYVDEESFIKDGGDLRGHQIASVNKNAHTAVPVGVFSQEDFSWLSAVIFSSCATWGKVRALSSDSNPNIFFKALRLNPNGILPHVIDAAKSQYKESLLDGMRVYHNPNATHKLSADVFRHEDVFQAYYSEEDADWIYEQRDGLLVWRSVFTYIPTSTV